MIKSHDPLANHTELRKTNKFNGYIKLQKPMTWILRNDFKLNGNVITMYYHLVSSALFDTRNKEFARTPFKPSHIPRELNYTRNSVKKWIHKLCNLNLISISSDGFIVINNYQKLFASPKLFLSEKERDELHTMDIYSQKMAKIISETSERN